MSNSAAKHQLAPAAPATVAEISREVEPMGDLSRLTIEDLSAEDEDEFFSILETA